ncbi:MAG: hypothetical protein ACRD9R_09890 [Pyrinomonadaceae bacterium]
MKDKSSQQQGAPVKPAMVEDKEAERRKQREMARGKLVIADAGKTAKPTGGKKSGKR